ncbi:small membrane A-kinase anchor protein-like [Engraulis encrasicolus]|uniref:small membrane A-kinase anchor protein-like n=1 Tax=Engraulis encrasicolus TaxID=184585 RepID=UPI002FCEC2A4
MGCVKSKKANSCSTAQHATNSVDGGSGGAGIADGKLGGTPRGDGEKAALVNSESGPGSQDSPCLNPVLMDYAQRLSEEIVARAVQQWAEVDSRYSDIPFIECDCDVP